MRSVGRSTGVFLMVLLKFRCRCCLYSGLLKVASKQDFEGRFCRYGFDPITIDFEMVKTKGNIETSFFMFYLMFLLTCLHVFITMLMSVLRYFWHFLKYIKLPNSWRQESYDRVFLLY